MTEITYLPLRAVLSVSGADRVAFLNGLVSNDVALAEPGRAVWAAMLTPQGKYLADFFVFAEAERLLLDGEAALAEDVQRRLQRYRLRADVAIAPEPLRVYAAWNGTPPDVSGWVPDPRLPEAGWRLLSAQSIAETSDPAAYNLHRLRLGLPDGTQDLEREKSVLLEAGFDELNGISWTKGCYMGQELTARTRYRGLVKRRLVPVRSDAALPAAGTKVLRNGEEVGQMRSSYGTLGLATLRLEALQNESALSAGSVALHLAPSSWMRLPQEA